jgi:vacuolar-type H+-ATPase subunit H
MNISDFNSLSHFTTRRSGSTKKSDSSSGKKIIRKRKNHEKFLLNKKKVNLSMINAALPTYENYMTWESRNEKGVQELRDVWKKGYRKKLREDFNRSSDYGIETLNQKKRKLRKIHRLRERYAAKILTGVVEEMEVDDIFNKFKYKYINKLPNNLSDVEKWAIVGQANRMVADYLDNGLTYDPDNLSRREHGWFSKAVAWVAPAAKTVVKYVAPAVAYVAKAISSYGTRSSDPSWFKWVPSSIQSKLRSLKNTLTSGINSIKNAVNSVKNKIEKKVKEFKKKINELADLIKNAPQKIKDSVISVVNSVKSSVTNSVSSVTNSIKNKINTIKSGVGNKLNNLGGGISSLPNTISSKVTGITSSLTGSVGKIFKGIKKAATSVVTKSTDFVKNMGKKVSSALKKVWNTVSGALKKAAKKVTDSIKSALKGIKKVAKSVFNFVKDGLKKLTRHMKKFVGKGWTWIKNTAKKAFNFFKKLLVKIWKWFKKIITRLFEFLKTIFGGKNIIGKVLKFLVKVTLILLLGPPGQLIARIKYLNGSLDKSWLLIPPLSIFPFSLAPTIMFMQNKIEKGVEDELPYDGFINTVMLFGISLPALELIFDTDVFFIFYAFYVFAAWLFIYSMRDKKRCKQVRGREDGWQFGKFLKSASMSALTFVIMRDVMGFIYKGLSFLPVVGIPLKVLLRVPFANVVLSSSTSAALVYILVNMQNNTPKNKYCDDYTTKKGLHTSFRSMGSLVIYFLAYSMIAAVKDLVL